MPGSLPTDAANPQAERHVLRFDVSAETRATFNEALAKRFYPDQNPLGKRIRPSFGPNPPWFTVVGVVQDVKQGGLSVPAGTEDTSTCTKPEVILGPGFATSAPLAVSSSTPVAQTGDCP